MSDAPLHTELPDLVRESGRAVAVSQTLGPAEEREASSLSLLAWLAAITVFLAVSGYCAWRLWTPAHDRMIFSPIFEDGRPKGLAGLIEERRAINAQTTGLGLFIDQVRIDTVEGRATEARHPLITGRGGIDDLREQWDAMCQRVRASLYDRRVAGLEREIAELGRRLALDPEGAQSGRLRDEIDALEQDRRRVLAEQRSGSNEELRCTPAAYAPPCSADAIEPWCEPELSRPGEFPPRQGPLE